MLAVVILYGPLEKVVKLILLENVIVKLILLFFLDDFRVSLLRDKNEENMQNMLMKSKWPENASN